MKQNTLRRLIAPALILCMAMPLAACGETDAEADDPASYIREYTMSGLGISEFDESAMSIIVNDDVPFFAADELTPDPFIEYGGTDDLDRVRGVALCADSDMIHKSGLFNTIADGITGFFDGTLVVDITPTGYNDKTYTRLGGKSLLGACTLVPDCLTTEANKGNYIAATASYTDLANELVSDTTWYLTDGGHILYRFTPVFENDELLSRGTLIEAVSVENNDIAMCRFIYNAEPGMIIDYADSTAMADMDYKEPEESGSDESGTETEESEAGKKGEADASGQSAANGGDSEDEGTDNADTYIDEDSGREFSIDEEEDTITYEDDDGESVTASISDIIEGIGDSLMEAQDVINDVGSDILGFIEKYGEEFWDMARQVAEHNSTLG